MRLVLKATQLGFTFGPRKPVEKPGSHGSTKWYYDEKGQIVYGERPPSRFHTPVFQPPAQPASPPEVPTLTPEEAERMGAEAFAQGRPAFPAMDAAFTAALGRATAGRPPGSALPLLDGWLHGWHSANVAAPPVRYADGSPVAVGDAAEVYLGEMQDGRGRVTDLGWQRVTIDKIEPRDTSGATWRIAYRDQGGSGGFFTWKPDVSNIRRPGATEPSGPVVETSRPTAAPLPPESSVRPPKAKTFADGGRVEPWEVLESEYLRHDLGREIRRIEANIKAYKVELGRYKPGSAKRNNYEFWIAMYEKDLNAIDHADQRKLDVIRRNAKLRYVKLVKAAISAGKPVPMEVIAQSVEFRKALGGRMRYEKGRHTSFANISAAVDTSTKEAYGFKTKRQDGTAITPAQREEIVKGVKEVEEVLGPLRDLMLASDLTIAHTNGKHPFMRGEAAGLYSIGERTISVGIVGLSGKPYPALAHELAHWLDYDAGRKLGRTTRVYRTNRVVETASLAEHDGRTSEGGNPGRALIDLATRSINDTREVRSLLKKRLNAAVDMEEKARIEQTKVMLGPYWREPQEVWARLVEQFVATRRGVGGVSHSSPEAYGRRAGWWTPEVFATLAPDVEREIKRRLEAARA